LDEKTAEGEVGTMLLREEESRYDGLHRGFEK
jgi:hypothetical protein